ncbi:MAG: NPCBM/NEW2 domain-containing protein [Planctomycetaceae bacterium]|nr:NPCBM/NEW2 domain-containing protein [Planctomycetaceae bacterium]
MTPRLKFLAGGNHRPFNTMKHLCFPFLLFIVLGIATLQAQTVPPIKIVAFIPSDCTPFDKNDERLGRVMNHVRDFYSNGMDANGFGKKTFELEWASPGKLRIYTVQGKKKQAEYGRNDSGSVRDEVKAAMMDQYKVDIDKEVVVIFQSLLRWENAKATELGPYVGGGNALSGTAWVYDDPLLDAAKLPLKQPGGYYNGHVSIGQFNTHYIGGVAHELGHAFGLPHECEKDDERAKQGASLMGGGNHTYGQELRKEGLGAFLSAASALQLSTVRAIVGDISGSRDRGAWKVEDISATYKDGQITFSGRFVAIPPVIGIIAFNDDASIESDYDAKTWVTKPDRGGRFNITIGELKQTTYQLRLVAVHEGGQKSQTAYDYTVYAEGPDLSQFDKSLPFEAIKRAFVENDRGSLDAILTEVTAKYPNSAVQRRAKHYSDLLNGTFTQIDLVAVPAESKKADLTWAKFVSAQTGWGDARRGSVPEDGFLKVGGTVYELGFYGHAPSSYKFDLGGKWNTLKSAYGLQDEHDGSVVFVVRGDGKELFRSEKITGHRLRNFDVDVTNIQELELSVEDAGDGPGADWGVWINPTLER